MKNKAKITKYRHILKPKPPECLLNDQLVADHSVGGISTGMYPSIIDKKRRITMLQTIAIILIVLWLLGLVSSYTMGGFIHVLLVIAVVIILLRLIQGRRL